jgi:ribonuclease HI
MSINITTSPLLVTQPPQGLVVIYTDGSSVSTKWKFIGATGGLICLPNGIMEISGHQPIINKGFKMTNNVMELAAIKVTLE